MLAGAPRVLRTLELLWHASPVRQPEVTAAELPQLGAVAEPGVRSARHVQVGARVQEDALADDPFVVVRGTDAIAVDLDDARVLDSGPQQRTDVPSCASHSRATSTVSTSDDIQDPLPARRQRQPAHQGYLSLRR